ncbi:caspase a-like isoform X2 [Betta splendens]|uniref:Caspase a-like isoform X2 n=1 Tax=Betta splendens TaxID=158456 RepID=A0A6P7PDF9_BETSP|nr:caspase a-like isoform X2 [Betta splendens]
MAEQLSTIRRKFIESVSKPVISELLDGLLEDGVLNDGEKDSILEENCGRADRARSLIDTVKRKGDAASKKMIAHIKRADPTLYSELVLSHAEPPAKEKQKMTRDETDNDIYPVTKENVKNRVALLITNITFTNVMYNRGGADIDEKNMEKLLSSLGYEVVKHTDLTAEQIHKAVLDFSKHPKLRQTDSVWVVMMSHGKLGNILGVNYNEADAKPDQFSINNIYTCLDSEHCPALLNKPKVIVIQACRGVGKGDVLISDGATAADEAPQSCPSDFEDFEDDAIRRVHKEKDFISLLSCTPDTVAYRQIDRGSLLIQFIVEVFKPSAEQDHIEELFRKVMRRFEDFSKGKIRQMPTKDRCTLTKHFYVFPRP